MLKTSFAWDAVTLGSSVRALGTSDLHVVVHAWTTSALLYDAPLESSDTYVSALLN